MSQFLTFSLVSPIFGGYPYTLGKKRSLDLQCPGNHHIIWCQVPRPQTNSTAVLDVRVQIVSCAQTRVKNMHKNSVHKNLLQRCLAFIKQPLQFGAFLYALPSSLDPSRLHPFLSIAFQDGSLSIPTQQPRSPNAKSRHSTTLTDFSALEPNQAEPNKALNTDPIVQN